ncbi:MAG: diphthine--ammonia ligase [Candidatus Nanohaloarchaea archaeon]
MKKAAMGWSGGKDSAYCLGRARKSEEYDVVELFTTVSGEFDRVCFHGLRKGLLERQAGSTGIPARTVELPGGYSQQEYAGRMQELYREYRSRGIETVIFADIYLEEVREERQEMLREAGLEGAWPVWGEDTGELAQDFVDRGFRAVTVSVDGSRLDRSFAGREFDREFIEDLPSGVDPCGENGEFHTFVYDGPVFENALEIETGEVVEKAVSDGKNYYAEVR